MSFNLYSSEGCHLCELALEICSPLIKKLSVIDIVDNDLVEQYGVHIPVLENLDSGKKLFWPFESQDVKELIEE